jgi:hypothetical protein
MNKLNPIIVIVAGIVSLLFINQFVIPSLSLSLLEGDVVILSCIGAITVAAVLSTEFWKGRPKQKKQVQSVLKAIPEESLSPFENGGGVLDSMLAKSPLFKELWQRQASIMEKMDGGQKPLWNFIFGPVDGLSSEEKTMQLKTLDAYDAEVKKYLAPVFTAIREIEKRKTELRVSMLSDTPIHVQPSNTPQTQIVKTKPVLQSFLCLYDDNEFKAQEKSTCPKCGQSHFVVPAPTRSRW